MSEFLIPGSGIFPDVNDSYYGAYRTRILTDIFPSYISFIQSINETPFKEEFGLIFPKLEIIYYLLYSRYGNSHIAYSDENQFKYALFTTIYSYAPAWMKKREIQEALITLDLDDEIIYKGGKAIYNHSYNPGTAPSTSSLEELTTINDQNTTNYKKSKLDGLSILNDLIHTDLTTEFLGKFQKLFISVLAPDYPLLYSTEASLYE